MTNKEILRALKLTASLLELYGENQFKVRSYNTAVYNLERLEQDLTQLDDAELNELPGVGKSIAKIIDEMNQTGANSALDNLLKQTPAGILELLSVKGIGAKKLKTVWDELQVETPDDLLHAAQTGALADLQGFGEKTQERVLQIITYHLENKKRKHYKDAHLAGLWLEEGIAKNHQEDQLSRAGAFRRKQEVVEVLEYIWGTDAPWDAEAYLDAIGEISKDHQKSGPLRWLGTIKDTALSVDVRFCKKEQFGARLVRHTGSWEHLNLKNNQGKSMKEVLEASSQSETQIYEDMGWPFVPPELREGLFEARYIEDQAIPDLVTMDQLKGVLHNHSTFSDGKNSLMDMAKQCQSLGYQYFGISDHSQTAVYANGLDSDQIRKQHEEIEAINKELAPFKVFKGIESDILNDGSLDYEEEILQLFDFIVASIHFNLNMDKKKATQRLIKAIENPYTTILGHPTGRQLLKREGYPIDHQAVIDACADQGVIIEINAHPWRLDLEWEWVHYALSKGVKISINPDAHSKAGLEDTYYGLCVGRKAGLTADMTFNALSVTEIGKYFEKRKQRAVTKRLVH